MMNIIVLKTNICDHQMVQEIAPHLNTFPGIRKWTIDTEDIDNVLRIECSKSLREKDIIQLIQLKGFSANDLPD